MSGMSSTPFRCLLVLVADRLSELVSKGELIACYYNPGNLFQKVHIIMTNEDHVGAGDIQNAVGDAELTIHNLPSPTFKRTLGWQAPLLESWIDKGCELARALAPDLIRTHNNFLEGYLAARIREKTGIPYIISLHGVWDRDCLRGFQERFRRFFRVKLERTALQNADAVIAVYAPILRYARAYGAKQVHLIYNAVSGSHIRKKEDYTLSSPVRLITVNRQVPEKNPEQIIRALASLDCRYTLIGDGELHGHLQEVAREAGCQDRVDFIQSMSNDKLCATLGDFDLMVSHCEYAGISKTLIEAAMTALPIVVNRQPPGVVPDLEGGWLTLCDNTPSAYRQAIEGLLAAEEARREAGLKAYRHAREHFEPQAMEEKIVALYRSVVEKKQAGNQGSPPLRMAK
jgi:glycosyltransferase involved in cell wall biosynthesis